jgi:hypothetical protein
MARKAIGPKASRRRRRLFLCTAMAAIAAAVIFIPSALAVHDNGVFQLDGDAQTSLQSTPPAAEDWDLICKANQVTAGTLAATISASTTSITVNETNGINPLLPVNIQIGTEQMTVTARSGSANPFTYTVTRAIDGTTAAAHSANDPVYAGCLFQHNYTAPSGTTGSFPHTFIVDQANTSVDDILKTGTKDDNNIPTWSWTTAGTLDKNDLTDGAAAEYTCSDVSSNCGTGHGSDKLIYFMADRYAISGSANVAFWFFQKRVQQYADGTGAQTGQCVTASGCAFTTDGKAPNGIPAGTSGSNLATHLAGTCGLPGYPAKPPGCNWGDILVIGAFGPHASLNVYQWVGAGNATKNYNGTNSCFTAACSLQPIYTAANGDCSAVGTADNACAVANTTVTASPWILPQKNISGKAVGDQFNADTVHGYSSFFEGGINLTGLGLGTTCFSSFLINSRSSAAGDSELHDKILGNFQRCSPNLTTQVQNSSGTNTNGTIQPGTPVHDTATVTVTGATAPADATGTVDFFLCGPNASAAPNCDGTTGNVGTQVGGDVNLTDTSNPANTTDGISGASSSDVNTSGSPLGNGYYCFRAEAHLTNYDNPDPFTNSTTECFQVLKVNSTIATDPETCTTTTPSSSVCSGNTGPFNLKDGTTVYDHAVVTGVAGDGFPDGNVTFYLCDPTQVSGTSGNEVCAQGAGTEVGSAAVDTTEITGSSPPQTEAFSVGTTLDGSTARLSMLGVWCFRAVFASTNPVYNGVDDANTHSECFTVQNKSSATSTQDWVPNDHITITADAGSIAGTLTVQLLKGACSTTAGGTVVYTDTTDHAFTATSTGATYDTQNTTYSTAYKVSSTSATGDDYYWRAVFTPDSSFAGGAVTKCEKSTLTINNNPS